MCILWASIKSSSAIFTPIIFCSMWFVAALIVCDVFVEQNSSPTKNAISELASRSFLGSIHILREHFFLSTVTFSSSLNTKNVKLMLLACHKKSYLICDEITNFLMFTKLLPFFFKVQNWDSQNRADSCLKKKFDIIDLSFASTETKF